jgi:hypothetical protein
MEMLDQVSSDLKSTLPSDLVDALLTTYDELKQNYFIGKHEPSELNGGKFCEACYRLLQYETDNGIYTPIGIEIRDLIGKFKNIENIPISSAHESFRIHIPRVLVAIYNIRNRRGVGHLGGDVVPNQIDSSLIVACADWVMAELFAFYYKCSLEEAQKIVNAFAQRRLTLVHQIDDIKRVLLPSLSQRNQVLLLLLSAYPDKVPVNELIKWVEPGNKSTFRNRVLRQLHRERMIEFDTVENCIILPTGLNYVSAQYPIWLSKLEGS